MEPCHSHTALQHTTVAVQPEPMHVRTRLTCVRLIDAQFGACTVAVVHLSLASVYGAIRPSWKNDQGSRTRSLLRNAAWAHRKQASTLLSPVGRFVSRAPRPRTGRCTARRRGRHQWAPRRPVVLPADLQTFGYLDQALHAIHQRGCGVCGPLVQSCATRTAFVTALVTHGK